MKTHISITFWTLCALLTATVCQAQHLTFADTLRGALRPERQCFDVTFYDLDIELFPEKKSIAGTVSMHYIGQLASDTIQVDLARTMQLSMVTQQGKVLGFRRVEDAVFIGLDQPTCFGESGNLVMTYEGEPEAAENPPWDGGFTWKTDSLGRVWAGVSCEGIGASIWWPNKDHLSDEPDSVNVSLTVPDPLRAISNGQFRGSERLSSGRTRYSYATTYPINNYNVTFYLGHYLSFQDTLYDVRKGEPLELHYSVLDYNLDRAKRHFEQVKPMLRCFGDVLGPYPFWKDGYRLIEAPYLGMEHQSAIAYGNNYMRGYRGGMIPPDMNWDYLIVHESGHEYFGNALSVTDHGEMWIHESFTTYLEALYVECRFGRADYDRYLLGQRGFIKNAKPIMGLPHVNFDDFGSSDHYFKGSWVLHTWRSVIGDEQFFQFLKGFYEAYAIGSVTTADFFNYVANNTQVEATELNPTIFWQQYLYQPTIPVLHVEQKSTGETIAYFSDVLPGFQLPLTVNGKRIVVSDRVAAYPISEKAWKTFYAPNYLIKFESQLGQ
ncbi:MAG: M1 family metallopeptidase [Saprospiraceae bacterium]